MRVLGKLIQLLTTAFVLGSVATVAVQGAGVGLLWSRGALTEAKLLQYTGVVYGLDPLDVSTEKKSDPQQAAPRSHEEILTNRVSNTSHLAERASTISRTTDDIRIISLTLKRNREKFVAARDGFESLLDQLEAETASKSLRELQITLEVAVPKQAKEILRAMLNSPPANPTDNVMRDVVSIVKSLPDNKLRKILAEFKTEDERKLLHRILVEIGELDERTNQLTRKQP